MANKKTIHQLESELEAYYKQLYYIVGKIQAKRLLIKRIRMGKIKQPEPAGKKVMLSLPAPEGIEFDDPIPSFGLTPAIGA